MLTPASKAKAGCSVKFNSIIVSFTRFVNIYLYIWVYCVSVCSPLLCNVNLDCRLDVVSFFSTYSFSVSAGAGGWSPLTSDRYQWLQVDLGERTKITAVATQGRYGSSDWLTSYLLMFSDTGHNWKQYRQEDSIGSFPGNSNADSVVQYKLQQPAIARFLRLLPLDWNPSGRIGLRLETYGCPYTSDVASFHHSCGGLVYKLSPSPRKTSRDVFSLKFKTPKNAGTLLHAEGHRGLSLSLELDRGKLLLLHSLSGSSSSEPQRLTSLGSLLDDQHWHHVVLERLLNYCSNIRNVVFLLLRVCDPDIVITSTKSGMSARSFHGCLENVLYNGLNLIERTKQSDQQGNVTFSCAESLSVAVTFPGPQNFLQLPGAMASHSRGVDVGMQFRTWNDAGLLLTFGLPQQGGVVWMYLSEAKNRIFGRVLMSFWFPGSALNDGQWHSVELRSRPGRLTVAVDREEGGAAHASLSFPFTTEGHLFFGGKRKTSVSFPVSVFQGCMRLLTLDNTDLDLILVQQKQLGNYSNLQFDMCGIMDRCSPSHCEHGGRCSQSWTSFHCNCSGTGHSGATCHSSVYEQSCEAYKHNGNTSGHFYIDVDGSGPIRPQLVYCNMTGDTHTLLFQVQIVNISITGCNGWCSSSFRMEQLLAAISQSDHCEQELSYHCRKSRLLNTPEGSPFSWWLGGPGSGGLQTYWGGAHPGSQQCACGLQGDCVDPQHYCNCDADRLEWAEDSGLLIHKDGLPVRSLMLGDVRRPGSEAAYRVGPLRCHGDKNLWNAAFFDKETSYLHFPTFHGELSADISFLFKTTASSGVFLENLGIKDFIRIELSSSTKVLFSFDVGNGPLEVSVESSVSLNDNRWHRVRAERNVKEASLRLDELPAATQEAPADGHFHLQLNSQLFIGTASRQKGFRGCIRSLQLNGVTLDLEERARITPGVRPGCPGHCSSYGSLCQNQGRCVERANGFHCDCSLSAYTGVFCHTEVSATFKSSTSVSYTFKEPYEIIRNSSALPSSIYSDVTLRGENVSLSFRTNQSPALLLYISSYHREYLALLINKHGEEDTGLFFSASITSFIITHIMTTVTFCSARPDSDDLDPDLARLAALGFTGCLSVVRFNSISPLKAALLHPDSSPVAITGPLVRSNCGSPASANPYAAENTHHLSESVGVALQEIKKNNYLLSEPFTSRHVLCLAGVIAVVIFVLLSGLAITARFLYRRKETYRNQEVKGVKQDDSQDFTFNNQTDSQHVSRESQKEYFI
uniref:Contactin associated protein like 3 n=1 Tax=Echeneis naucrates TaxID=173247 RepID=A0A665XEV7_ECHNA